MGGVWPIRAFTRGKNQVDVGVGGSGVLVAYVRQVSLRRMSVDLEPLLYLHHVAVSVMTTCVL